MARCIYEDRMGEHVWISDILDATSLEVISYSDTQVTMTDAQGEGVTVQGQGLVFDEMGNLTGGRFTSLELFNANGRTMIMVDRFDMDAARLTQALYADGLMAAWLLVFSRDDRILGSEVGDYLEGGKGDDTILGAGGQDVLHGAKGVDQLTGGRGADVFVLRGGDGIDHILDFKDEGAASDDMIAITRGMYRDRVVTETATGVEIAFGDRGGFVVDGWHAADVGRDDFLFF